MITITKTTLQNIRQYLDSPSQRLTRHDIKQLSEQIPDLKDILQNFAGKKNIFLIACLRGMYETLKTQASIKLHSLIIDQHNFSDVALPAGDLLSLTINFDGMSPDDVGKLHQRLSGIPIHNLSLRNVNKIDETIITHFLEQLPLAELVNVPQTKSETLDEFVEQMTYRNQYLKATGIKKSSNLWKAILNKWLTTSNQSAANRQSSNTTSYLQPLNDEEAEEYNLYLMKIADPRDSSSHYNNINRAQALTFERTNLSNAAITGMGDMFFENMLSHLNDDLELPGALHGTNLALDGILNEKKLMKLAAYIASQSSILVFTQLSLHINAQLLNSEAFSNVLKALKNKNIHLQLVWRDEGDFKLHQRSISSTLQHQIVDTVNYPLTIKTMKYGIQRFSEIEAMIIRNIQKHNFIKLQTGVYTENDNLAESKSAPDENVEINKFAQQINLKKLLNKKSLKDDFSNYVKVEVQHTETVQEVQQQEEAVEAIVEQVNESTHYEKFEGLLVGYDALFSRYSDIIFQSNPDYQYDTKIDILNEFFANHPQGIKYLSPAAAMVFAQNLPAFAALNIDNLPQNFILKKTALGEFVFDYDQHAAERQVNVFTPKAYSIIENPEPLYKVDLLKTSIKKWINNDALFNAIYDPSQRNPARKLANLWIKFGDAGIKLFFEKMNAVDEKSPKFALFLYESYLKYFTHWDHLATKEFLNTLDKINQFDINKITCLKKFLQNTGRSKHNFVATLQAFEFFWERVEALCVKHKAEISAINSNWKTLGGNPIVYMQRLLTILENSRNLEEQLACLPNLTLNNYGAYYASKYEDFKVVTAEMGFNTRTDQALNALSFSVDRKMYRQTFDGLSRYVKTDMTLFQFASFIAQPSSDSQITSILINSDGESLTKDEVTALIKSGLSIPYEPANFKPPYKLYILDNATGIATLKADEYPRQIPQSEFKKLACRLIGQQSSGINIKDYVTGLNSIPDNEYMNFNQTIFTSLFFVSHERYKNQVSVKDLLRIIQGQESHREVSTTTIKYLMDLRKLDINLNDVEGDLICKYLTALNSHEFERHRLDKITYIKKMFDHLKNNKYAMLKCLSVEPVSKEHYAFALDTAEFFATNFSIKVQCKDDLLLFASLINSDYEELYYAGKDTAKVLKVKEYLLTAATSAKPNNLDYAFQAIVQSKKYFTYQQFLSAFEEISTLAVIDFNQVDLILKKHKFNLVNTSLPLEFAGDSHDLRNSLILALLILEQYSDASLTGIMQINIDDKQDEFHKLYEEVSHYSVAELQERLNKAWAAGGTKATLLGAIYIKPLLRQIKNNLLDINFQKLPDITLTTIFKEKITAVKEIADDDSFEKVNRINTNIINIVNLLNQIVARENFLKNKSLINDLFANLDFKKFDYEMLYALLAVIQDMPQRSYANILVRLFAVSNVVDNKDNFLQLIGYLSKLNSSTLPSAGIENIISFAGNNIDSAILSSIIVQLISLYEKDKTNPLLNFVFNNLTINIENLSFILKLNETIDEKYHHDFSNLFSTIHNKKALNKFLKQIQTSPEQTRIMLLEILAKSNGVSRLNPGDPTIDYVAIVKSIQSLNENDIQSLHDFFTISTINISYLGTGLAERDKTKPFADYLKEMEKSPFGKRNLKQQFDTTELERVVNNAIDLQNQSIYTYEYRKQLMEAVLFVNDSGHQLNIYHNKSARELSNEELRNLFQAIKSHQLIQLDPFQTKLYALGLMREAMYRATNELPNITQITGLVDSIMHEGDVISNIDTGQGKSLVDTMKGAILWLAGDRVDITTSSHIDAKIQLEHYSPFLKLLDIPYADKVITAGTDFTDFKQNGLNFSTFSSLALFFSRARTEGMELSTPETKVSVVINESDHAILDDKTIYRYAVNGGNTPGYNEEWIYYAINDFIDTAGFKASNTSTEQDIAALRKFLHKRAQQEHKSQKTINKFDDDKLLMWIESALIVRHSLRENFDYVIPPEAEQRIINGQQRTTQTVKILFKDGKISNETTYGNGMQQLLYASLNQKLGAEKFVIEPESTTIISTNNKNLIEYYQAHDGFIWGSSGTVGSNQEIAEQYSHYGFAFSKIQPHQKNIVTFKKPVVLANEESQQDEIIKQADKLRYNDPNHVTVIFAKDIETAQKLFKKFQLKHGEKYGASIQLFTGVGHEEEVIRTAAKPGQITITTSALGRNTNIPYQRKLGMSVFHTYVDSIRGAGQKSGRTGRQGSAGQVHYYFNKEELNGKTPEQIANEIDVNSARAREFNEDLYNVIGYLLTIIYKIPATDFAAITKNQFLRNHWANFTVETETNYREARLKNSYSKEKFITASTQALNQLLLETLDPTQRIVVNPGDVLAHLQKLPAASSKYNVDNKSVKITDCTPSSVTAYGFISDTLNGSTPLIATNVTTKEAVTDKLTTLFKNIARGKLNDVNKDYHSYLHSSPQSIQVIRDAHQSFLNNFITKKINQATNSNFIKRFLGYKSGLNKIANDQSYIIMFKAMTKMNAGKTVIDFDTLKKLVITMINEYQLNSWFTNQDRRQAARALIAAVEKADNINALFAELAASQTKSIGRDIATNKRSFWRYVKPLNYSGNSRFQNTLNDIVVLMSVLTASNFTPASATGLINQLKTATNNMTALQALENNMTSDNFQVIAPQLPALDKGNAKVLKKGLDKMLSINMLFSKNDSMRGRPPTFKYNPRAEKTTTPRKKK